MADELKPPVESRAAMAPAVSGAGKNSSLKLWLLFGAVLASLLIVLLVLPSFVSETGSVEPMALPGPDQSKAGVLPQVTSDTDQSRADAELALQAFLHLQAQPDLAGAEIWIADEWFSALDSANIGDKEFGKGMFAPALEAYQTAGIQLQNILDNREQTLQQSLAAGWQYLQDNSVDEANTAFGRVIAMQPDHQDALLGLERAAVRDEVLELVATAGQAEMTGQLRIAGQSYSTALQLDPLYLPAEEALGQVRLALSNKAFQDFMGKTLQSLDQGDFAAAEQALSQAAKIRPEDPAVSDARQRLKMARRSAGLSELRTQAELLEKDEKWTKASASYRLALAIDPQAVFARNGLAQAQSKQQLHIQLDHYLADETRLFSDEPLENARNLLEANQADAAREPLLTKKLTALQQAVELAVIPIDLLILSDALTEVTIYKVGRLGSFEQKQLSLRPGDYTIMGSRQGYRDVLKVIELRPGMKTKSVQISSGEQI